MGMLESVVVRGVVMGASLVVFSCAPRCGDAGSIDRAMVGPSGWSVRQYGDMRPVMREGQTGARVGLAECTGTPHAFAVGAIEGLDGEITVIDGEVWISRVRGGEVETTGPGVSPTDRGTLLTVAQVGSWREVRLDAAAGGADLEAVIERAGARQGLDTSRPFPFVIEGEASSLDMHVVNGYCPHGEAEAESGHEPWRLTLKEPAHATVVGFYAKDSAGVMTHHGTCVHAHAVLEVNGRTVTGHVDEVAFGAGAVLRLPDGR